MVAFYREGEMEDISLLDEEEAGLVFNVESAKQNSIVAQLCLVGRFISDRPIRVHIMKERMAVIWIPVKGVAITEASPGIYLFQFYHQTDMLVSFREARGRLIIILWFLLPLPRVIHQVRFLFFI